MNENDFEGSLILEKVAQVGQLDEFFEAIDNDDFDQARSILEAARIDEEEIQIVLKKMREADSNH